MIVHGMGNAFDHEKSGWHACLWWVALLLGGLALLGLALSQ